MTQRVITNYTTAYILEDYVHRIDPGYQGNCLCPGWAYQSPEMRVWGSVLWGIAPQTLPQFPLIESLQHQCDCPTLDVGWIANPDYDSTQIIAVCHADSLSAIVDNLDFPGYKHLKSSVRFRIGGMKNMKLLTVSDIPVSYLYGPQVRQRFTGLDLMISCGDLPHEYLEYLVNCLDVLHYYVHGNHDQKYELTTWGNHLTPMGGIDLHCRVERYRGLLMAGVEGSLRYNDGPFQYSQSEMWMNVFRIVPGMLANRLRYGRYLDLFVTHAPPLGIHDQPDLPHRGLRAFRWLIDVFHPTVHVHGHIHVYRPGETVETQVGSTLVLNTFGFREFALPLPPGQNMD